MSTVQTDYGQRGEPKTNNIYNAVFTDKKDNSTLSQSDFLKLMVAQMQNQDFTNPMDDTQMVTQMVQFSNMQQMQEMASYSKTMYAMSLLGKVVTASRFTVNGDLDTTTGPVQKVSLVDDEYVIYVGGKKYSMEQIMGVETGTEENISAVTPGNFTLKAGDTTTDTAEISWEIPTEDDQTASNLKYSVYYSTEGPFSTVEAVEQGTLVGAAGQKGITSEVITGLDAGTTYYVNVVVEDASGSKSVYAPVKVKTKTA